MPLGEGLWINIKDGTRREIYEHMEDVLAHPDIFGIDPDDAKNTPHTPQGRQTLLREVLHNDWMRARLHGGAIVFEYAGDPEWAAIRATEVLRDIAGPHTHVTIKNVDNGTTTSFAAHELLDVEEGFQMFAKLCGPSDSVRKLELRQAHARLLSSPAKPVDRLVVRQAQVPPAEPVEPEEEEPDEYSEQELERRLMENPNEAVNFMTWYNQELVGLTGDYKGYEFAGDAHFVVGRDFEVFPLEDAPAQALQVVEQLKARGLANPAESFFRREDHWRRMMQ